MSRRVYLAGPITGTSFDECVDWRLEWCEEFQETFAEEGIEMLSPMRGKGYLSGEDFIRNNYPCGETYPLCTDRATMARDHFDCTRAECIVFNVLGARMASLGTTMEAAWGYRDHTPMIWIMEKEGNPHDHVMLRCCMDFRTDDEQTAKQIVRAILNSGVPHRL